MEYSKEGSTWFKEQYMSYKLMFRDNVFMSRNEINNYDE